MPKQPLVTKGRVRRPPARRPPAGVVRPGGPASRRNGRSHPGGLRSLLGYKGAKSRGHNERRRPANRHPDAEIIPEISLLRGRVRDLIRNTPEAANLMHVYEDHVVGPAGIRPQPQAVNLRGKPDQRFNEAALLLFEQMAQQLDLRRLLDFGELQATSLTGCATAGASLLHMPVVNDPDLPVPLQVYGIEPDYLAGLDTQNGETGNEIRGGVELDKVTGRPVAFHVLESNRTWSSTKTRRLPAAEVAYMFRLDRWGQILGAPWLAPVIDKTRDLDEYIDAEIVRARVHATDAKYLETPFAEGRMQQWTKEQESAEGGIERVTEDINLGMLTILHPGEKIAGSDSNIPPGNYEPFLIQHKRAIATGLGVSYEMLTGDHTKTHFSASRATWQRDIRRFRYLQRFVVRRFCRPLYERMIDLAVMVGRLSVPNPALYLTDPSYRWRYLRCDWRPPGFAWHDPVKDVEAARQGIALGVQTRGEVCQQRGRQFREVIDELAEEEKYIEHKGLKLISAPGDLKALAFVLGVEKEGEDDGEVD